MTRDQMFACALEQPGAEDSTLHGGRCVRVRGHWIVNESREADALALALDLETYSEAPHYEGGPAVLVRYAVADDDRLREQIEKSWARRATQAQRRARGLA